MRVLVVGSGGREHALIKKIKESSKVDYIACCPGNGGISYDAECIDVSATDIDGVVETAKKINADFVVVAPDDPLAMGAVDKLNEAGFPTFGPKANAAMIESSKVFSKNLMKKYNIPTAKYEVFSDPKEAIAYIEKENSFPTVIKADGLALGKGVIIPETLEEAKYGISKIMEDKVFGASGNNVVVEEFLTGPEVSVLAFTDGKCVKPMVTSMDHKRAHDGDTGLNTGGMGTISPNPYYTKEIADQCMKEIFIPTIEAMNSEGRPFQGCLYFGLMLTPNGPKVIEYNCRFGDPETQVVLPRLKTDIIDIFEAINNECLEDLNIEWDDNATACVVIASGGYPEAYEKGKELYGLNSVGQYDSKDIIVFHAGSKIADGKLVSNGGRVLGVTAIGDDLQEALDKAYVAVNSIGFEKSFYRNDIGKKALDVLKDN